MPASLVHAMVMQENALLISPRSTSSFAKPSFFRVALMARTGAVVNHFGACLCGAAVADDARQRLQAVAFQRAFSRQQ
jgi:hypothetical protein